MPVYLYKILETGETFEYEQRISEDALTEHPETGQPVRRVIQPVGIAFKGSGFYVNDSRASGNGAPRGGGKATSDGAASAAEGSAGAAKSTGEAAGGSVANSSPAA